MNAVSQWWIGGLRTRKAEVAGSIPAGGSRHLDSEQIAMNLLWESKSEYPILQSVFLHPSKIEYKKFYISAELPTSLPTKSFKVNNSTKTNLLMCERSFL